jgi:hypothetical protein
MSRGAFLIPKLTVLGNRQAEATQMLVSKGLSTITAYQASFVEDVLELLKRHQSRKQRDLALEIIDALARSTDPPFYFIDRGTEARITVANTQVDISTVANIKVYWGYDGTEITSTSTATPGNVYSAEVQIQDFPLYHGNFYKLNVLYEDGTDRYPLESLYVVVKASQSVDSALLAAPTLVSAITDGGGEFTTFTWTNPTHRDFRFAQLRTSDGLILYRGNGTSYVWYHDKSGSENLTLYSEGPGGHVVASEPFGIDALTISTNVTAGGTNLEAIATAQATGIEYERNIFFSDGDPIKEAWVFGEADVRVDGFTGDSLAFSGDDWAVATANYAALSAYGYSFRFEVDDCDGVCIYSSAEALRSFESVLMLLMPHSETGAFVAGTPYTYRIMVMDPTSSAVQQILTGCLKKLPCPNEVEDVPPNDHYVYTNVSSDALETESTSSDCGCS